MSELNLDELEALAMACSPSPYSDNHDGIPVEFFASVTPKVVGELVRRIKSAEELAAANLSSLNAKPGDLILLRLSGDQSRWDTYRVNHAARQLRERLPEGVSVLIATDDTNLSVLSDEALDRAGLMRKGARQKSDAAMKTLEGMGYRWKGGSLWAPPLGPVPEFVEREPWPGKAVAARDQAVRICADRDRECGGPAGWCDDCPKRDEAEADKALDEIIATGWGDEKDTAKPTLLERLRRWWKGGGV